MPVGIYERSEKQKEFCRQIGRLRGGRKRILQDIICPVCNLVFRPKVSISKYCSYNCFNKDKGRKRKGIYKNCLICKKKYYVLPTYIKSNKYCSRKCQHKGLVIPESKIELKCKFCKEKYITERSHIKWRGSSYCSRKCFKEYRKTKFYKNNKMKKTTGAILKKTLWNIFSQYIRQRDNGICISCGKKDFWRKMDAGHYIPKTAGLSLYFDEQNVNCQCTYCNRWMHGNLSKYAIALRKKYGKTILEDLDKKRRITKKISVDEYKNIIEEFKIKLNKVEENS